MKPFKVRCFIRNERHRKVFCLLSGCIPDTKIQHSQVDIHIALWDVLSLCPNACPQFSFLFPLRYLQFYKTYSEENKTTQISIASKADPQSWINLVVWIRDFSLICPQSRILCTSKFLQTWEYLDMVPWLRSITTIWWNIISATCIVI